MFSPAHPLTLAELAATLRSREPLRLPPEAQARIQACHAYLHQRLAGAPEESGYSLSSGFGAPPDGSLPPAGQPPRPASLLLSHAGGTGAEVPAELVRLMLLLKVQSLSYGHGGVAPATVQRLLDMYNREMYPVVYEQGAAGPFGESSALAHLSLPLLGLGEVNYQGYRLAAADALSLFSWAPLALSASEELALLSGTHFTLAYAVEAALRAERLGRAADVIGALSLKACGGRAELFDERLHRLRPHAGQAAVARRLRGLLAGSELQALPRSPEPDPYSFRCLPQVHGASRDALAYIQQTIEIECNSVTENPAIFPEEDQLVSGGNFHGQPLALALDHLALAVAGLGSISERRTSQLLSEPHALPPLLAAGPGQNPELTPEPNPGLLTSQYTAAGLVSQNKQLCAPASVDFIGSSSQADHVSMSANAATKVCRVVENTELILSVELLAAAWALARRHPARSSEALEAVLAAFAGQVPPGARDQPLYLALPTAAGFVRRFDWP